MQHTRQIEKVSFLEIVEKMQFLTVSQQKFLKEMLSRPEKASPVSRKKLLKKSFGLWSGRDDIKGSLEYVDEMRKGWETRMKRVKG